MHVQNSVTSSCSDRMRTHTCATFMGAPRGVIVGTVLVEVSAMYLKASEGNNFWGSQGAPADGTVNDGSLGASLKRLSLALRGQPSPALCAGRQAERLHTPEHACITPMQTKPACMHHEYCQSALNCSSGSHEHSQPDTHVCPWHSKWLCMLCIYVHVTAGIHKV